MPETMQLKCESTVCFALFLSLLIWKTENTVNVEWTLIVYNCFWIYGMHSLNFTAK